MQSVFAEKFYEGFKVYDIKLKSQDDFKFLMQLEQHGSSRGLDFWSLHNDLNELARVLVKPSEQRFFEDSLKKQHLHYEVVIADVQGIVDQELKEHKELASLRRTPGVITFDRYYQHEEINKYLDEIEKNYQSNPLVKVKSVGKSFEGREIKTITITNGDGKKKNSVFIDAGIHAREWIAPATALYLIEQLLDSNSSYSRVLEQMDIVIMPVVNPDGYEYTFTRVNRQFLMIILISLAIIFSNDSGVRQEAKNQILNVLELMQIGTLTSIGMKLDLQTINVQKHSMVKKRFQK